METKLLKQFEEQCTVWLNTPRELRDIGVGATLMLQANKNKIMHQSVLARSNFDKIEYELKKFLGDKFRTCNPAVVQQMVLMVKSNEETQRKEGEAGMRPDHEQLAPEIQRLYERNREVYQKMRSIHERIKILSGDGFTPCDRFPFLKELMGLDKELRENWDRYDQASAVMDDVSAAEGRIPLTIQQAGAARSYISRMVREIPAGLKSGKDQTSRIQKARKAYVDLISDGQEIKPETRAALINAGIITETE